jgi:hypothetical protein
MTAEVPQTLPERVRTWAEALAPQPVVEVSAIGGGITNTKLLRLAAGDPLVLRWCDPFVWGAIGREHVRREALACRLLAGCSPTPRFRCHASWPATSTGPTLAARQA